MHIKITLRDEDGDEVHIARQTDQRTDKPTSEFYLYMPSSESVTVPPLLVREAEKAIEHLEKIGG